MSTKGIPAAAFLFLSTPSARRATVDGPVSVQLVEFLSTPSARRATAGCRFLLDAQGISIHALREEGDPRPRSVPGSEARNFYPRPPRGGRRCAASKGGSFSEISIHALREEGDLVTRVKVIGLEKFLSTPSARRATF